MASTNTTTNYGLPLYEDGDLPDWKDTNTAFTTIDTQLKNALNAIAALQTQINGSVHTGGQGLTVAQYSTLGVSSND